MRILFLILSPAPLSSLPSQRLVIFWSLVHNRVYQRLLFFDSELVVVMVQDLVRIARVVEYAILVLKRGDVRLLVVKGGWVVEVVISVLHFVVFLSHWDYLWNNRIYKHTAKRLSIWQFKYKWQVNRSGLNCKQE